MTKEGAELLAAMTTAGLGALGIVGLAVRYVLLPWLKQHLVTPLLERLDTLSRDMVLIAADTKVAGAMYDGHIERSAAESGRVWAAIRALQRHQREDTKP